MQNEQAKKTRSILSQVMAVQQKIDTRNYGKPQFQSAGESAETKDKGAAKSVSFVSIDRSTSNDSDQKIIGLLETLNDLRYEVSEVIKRELQAGDVLQSYELMLRPGLMEQVEKKTAKKGEFEYGDLSGQDYSNELTRLIRERTSSIIATKNNKYGHLHQQASYWISYDLAGRIASYIQLLKNGGIDDIKSLFQNWQLSHDGEVEEIDVEIANNILGKNFKKITEKQLKAEFLQMTLNQLYEDGMKPGNVSLDDVGGIRGISGRDGVDEYNIIANKLNTFIGQYRGQKTNKAIVTIQKDLEVSFCSSRDLFLYADGLVEQEKINLIERFQVLKSTGIQKAPEIKKYPGFPTFHPTSHYKEGNNIEISFSEYLNIFNELEISLKALPIDINKALSKILGVKLEEINAEYCHDIVKSNHSELSRVNSQKEASRRRFARRLLSKKHNMDLLWAIDQEQRYYAGKVKGSLLTRRNAKGFQIIATAMGKYLRFLLQTRRTQSDRLYYQYDLEIKRAIGGIQMLQLHLKPYSQFSFQFRQLDQAGIYPVFGKRGEKDSAKFMIKAYSTPKKSQSKIDLEYLTYHEGAPVFKRSKIDEGSLLEIPLYFGVRQGRKFFFNNVLSPSKTTNPAFKLGAPNFNVRYIKAEKGCRAVDVRGAIAFTKQMGTNDRITYSKELKGDEQKSKYLVEQIKYLIGIDRGENKLLCCSVYDVAEGKVIEQFVLGDEFKSRIDEMKCEQEKLRKAFNRTKMTAIDRKISGYLKNAINSNIASLIKVVLDYSDRSKKIGLHTGIVFEFLPKQLGRQGRRAYVELRQMGKLIDAVREMRNYYDLPFHIFEVGPAFTSQICSQCGAIDKKSRNLESFRCTKCGFEADADLQASYNILIKWLANKDAQSRNLKKTDYIKNYSDYILKKKK